MVNVVFSSDFLWDYDDASHGKAIVMVNQGGRVDEEALVVFSDLSGTAWAWSPSSRERVVELVLPVQQESC
ncbi:hypothetical protein QVD17_07465 [Tagetes erecta]|uniref:Uncharacterized protein n=1 Tax=Tagetes erecta TaxID=13708 RepID=A0AAD8PCK9_TARER|nr:hypothetical protein QVD17_07465 [Tagetes erecta]